MLINYTEQGNLASAWAACFLSGVRLQKPECFICSIACLCCVIPNQGVRQDVCPVALVHLYKWSLHPALALFVILKFYQLQFYILYLCYIYNLLYLQTGDIAEEH